MKIITNHQDWLLNLTSLRVLPFLNQQSFANKSPERLFSETGKGRASGVWFNG
jgi:hypothetical protein